MKLSEVAVKVKVFIDDRIKQINELDATALIEISENPIYHEKFNEFVENCIPDMNKNYIVETINAHFSKSLGVEATVGQIFDEPILVEVIMQPFFVEALKEYVGYQK